MQFQYLPVEERFFVRMLEERIAEYPAGAFSLVSNYPVYAMRLHAAEGENLTEFFIPASDGSFQWVDMRHTRLSRR